MRKSALALLVAILAASPVPAAPRNATPPASSGSVRLDWRYLVGFWTDDGDCSHAIEFMQDRRFITDEGGEGLWHLEGDTLTMTGEHTVTVRIVTIDRDTINVINSDGSRGRSTRCAERTSPPPPLT